ncbi:MAG: DUF2950 family protein [Planctomycetota bacterium]|nr:DUF2950 family protein [Planctomycetota bacterium]
MDKNTTTTAVVTALLVAGAMLLGSMAFPRVEVQEAPAPAYEPEAPMRVEAEPEDQPALEPMRIEDTSEIAELKNRVAALEETIEGMRQQQARTMKELEPLLELAKKARRSTLSGPRKQANETAAIATLRNATSAQAQVQATARIDVDQDGTGEFGGFLEMSGEIEGRMTRRLVPPVLSSAFRKMPDGVVVRSGYCYRIFLPGGGGQGVAEPKTGFANDGTIVADLAETTWCCYAWPVEYGKTGTRSFFMNQAGDTLATDDERYSGPQGGPDALAAFVPGGSGGIVGAVAHGKQGNDGNVWKQVN